MGYWEGRAGSLLTEGDLVQILQVIRLAQRAFTSEKMEVSPFSLKVTQITVYNIKRTCSRSLISTAVCQLLKQSEKVH